MAALPARGRSLRSLGLVLPPCRMPLWRQGRPLKRWRYLGVYAPQLMLCVGDARIGPVPRRWWAVTEPGGTLHQRSSARRAGVSLASGAARVKAEGVRIELELGDCEAVEIASPVGCRGNYIWTRKRGGFEVRGLVRVGGREHTVEGPYGFYDESAGYHARHTAWKWSAGVGWTHDGRHLAWNLVSGVHDGPQASERTVWIDGEPREVGPVEFAADLSGVAFADGAGLRFDEWAARVEETNLLLLRSFYLQPFGTFSGELPGGLRLSEGCGVMEDHDVWW